MAAVVLAGLLIVPPVGLAALRAVHPPGREEMQMLLAQIAPRVRDRDVIYIYHSADRAYLYYRDRYGLGGHAFIHGTRTDVAADAFERDVAALRGRGRVWVIVSHAWDDEEAQLLRHLDVAGQRREAFHAVGANAYLYEMDAP